jgi:hypothetical protein
MRTAIQLMYVEGEVRDGYITGRTVLVVETRCELDPASPYYSAPEIARLIKLAREQWVGQFGPVDIVRLEKAAEGAAGVNGRRRIAS